MTIPPCKDYTERYVTSGSNCHATCKRYLEWEKERKEELEAKYKAKRVDDAIIEMRNNLKRK